MEIKIRYYRSSDYIMLLNILKKVYNSNIDQEVLEERYISENRSILVAVEKDEGLVGCAFIEVQEDFVRPSRVLYITYVAVDENYRKQGIGKKLFDRIKEECIQKKCSTMELTSADYRTDAHAFYDRIGFTKKKTTLFIKEIL